MPELLSRKDALAKGEKFYFTGKACKHGHVAERYALYRVCVVCRDVANKQYLVDNRAKVNSYNKKYREADPERAARYARTCHENNPSRRKAGKALYRAQQLRATPNGLTPEQREEINVIYATCPDGCQVDHIEPLQGVNVCGLHVPWNLRHLDAALNRSKGNRRVD